MGHMFITASKSITGNPILITSVCLTPLNETSVSALATLINATAIVSGTRRLFLHCSTAGHTVVWNNQRGIKFDKLYVALAQALVTIVWK